MHRKLLREIRCGEAGSISVLISGLFLLVFILSVGIIDVSDTYLAKRELIQIGEDAILVASHSLNASRYYTSSQIVNGTSNNRVPIDCMVAASKFNSEIRLRSLRKNLITVSGWSCSNDQITASISSNIRPIVNFPILTNIAGGVIRINSIIGATSELATG